MTVLGGEVPRKEEEEEEEERGRRKREKKRGNEGIHLCIYWNYFLSIELNRRSRERHANASGTVCGL